MLAQFPSYPAIAIGSLAIGAAAALQEYKGNDNETVVVGMLCTALPLISGFLAKATTNKFGDSNIFLATSAIVGGAFFCYTSFVKNIFGGPKLPAKLYADMDMSAISLVPSVSLVVGVTAGVMAHRVTSAFAR